MTETVVDQIGTDDDSWRPERYRHLVVCCDGTGNSIGADISNVMKLYRIVRKTDRTSPHQIVYYQPGVGTLSRPKPWTRLVQGTQKFVGLATGYGLDDNVLGAYRFLIENYRKGDKLFFFGFSRGAYTVRILAALIHKVGLLTPEQSHLADSALGAYKRTPFSIEKVSGSKQGFVDTVEEPGSQQAGPEPKKVEDQAAQFARMVSPRWPNIDFVGVWDTVASVLIPRGGWFRHEELIFTRQNPSVRAFRQAISIDETRAMFRLHPWFPNQDFRASRFTETQYDRKQDIKQVYFPGVHADVGGGYPETESGLSKFSLIWMLSEAKKYGLTYDPRTFRHLAWGAKGSSPYQYVAPCFTQDIHDPYNLFYRPQEYYPKRIERREWSDRPAILGRYLPLREPRFIPEESIVHASAFLKRGGSGAGYDPKNLGPEADYLVEPMPTLE